jgi:hypothetical protein
MAVIISEWILKKYVSENVHYIKLVEIWFAYIESLGSVASHSSCWW